MAVHEERLDRRGAAARRAPQRVAGELPSKRLGAKRGEQRVNGSGCLPQQGAEAARIGEAQDQPPLARLRFEPDVDVVVPARRRIGWQHAQRAGHAQVEQRTARRRMQQQIFCAALHRVDALAGQALGNLARDRPAQVRTTQRHHAHAPADQIGRNATARGFDFGKFRHTDPDGSGATVYELAGAR